jgi:hypothetical protein
MPEVISRGSKLSAQLETHCSRPESFQLPPGLWDGPLIAPYLCRFLRGTDSRSPQIIVDRGCKN